MALSKTKYCRGLQCEKMLWLDENMSEVADLSLVNDSVFETGNEVITDRIGIRKIYIENKIKILLVI